LIVDGNHAASRVNATATHDLFSEIDAADIAATIAALPTYALPGAAWYLSNFAYATTFCRLAVSSGADLVSETVNGVTRREYLGWPVRISSTSPQTSASQNGAVMLLFGDLAMSSTIGNRTGAEIKTSTQRFFENDQYLFRGRQRFDLVNHDVGDATTAGPMVGLVGVT
jgi:HK97 family phage major capsid protein